MAFAFNYKLQQKNSLRINRNVGNNQSEKNTLFNNLPKQKYEIKFMLDYKKSVMTKENNNMFLKKIAINNSFTPLVHTTESHPLWEKNISWRNSTTSSFWVLSISAVPIKISAGNVTDFYCFPGKQRSGQPWRR